MSRTCRSLSRKSALIAGLVGLALPLCAADYRKEARDAVAAPFKVAVRPVGQGQKAGEPIDVSLQLQNGKSQPSAASKYTPIQIQLLGKSGQIIQSEKCGIQANSTDGTCTFQAPQAGIYTLKALPDDHRLLEGSSFLLVVPNNGGRASQPAPKVKEKPPPSAKPQARFNDGYHPEWLARYGGFLFNTAYQTGNAGGGAAAQPGDGTGGTVSSGCSEPLSRGHAKVALLISEGSADGGAFRAVVESATITAFFQADDGGAAPRAIRVWLSPDHGSLDPPFLVIPTCSYSGETRLASKFPVVASVGYSVVPGIYPVDAPSKLTARFLRPIVTVHIEPSGPQTLSLIDRVPFIAEFIDINGTVVPTDLERDLNFVSNSSAAGPGQETVTARMGDWSAGNVVLPFSTGKATISVTADGLQPAVHDVEVVGAAVYWCCLIGGLLGGLIAALNAGGFKLSRVVTGVVSGIVLTWAYVFGLVPRVDSAVAHNYLSVLVVSILGGYAGTKVFAFVFQRMGWSL
jgi:hypothetical protein